MEEGRRNEEEKKEKEEEKKPRNSKPVLEGESLRRERRLDLKL